MYLRNLSDFSNRIKSYYFETMKKLHAGTLFTIVQVSVMVEVGASVSQVLGIRFSHHIKRHSVRCFFDIGKFLHHFNYFPLKPQNIASTSIPSVSINNLCFYLSDGNSSQDGNTISVKHFQPQQKPIIRLHKLCIRHLWHFVPNSCAVP